jgi:hypothetical protein
MRNPLHVQLFANNYGWRGFILCSAPDHLHECDGHLESLSDYESYKERVMNEESFKTILEKITSIKNLKERYKRKPKSSEMQISIIREEINVDY